LSRLDDLSAHAVELLKQLLSSLAGKEKVSEVLQELGNGKVIEEANQVSLYKAADIAESSAQGEARGAKVNPKPYYHRCLSKGHVKEECSVVLVCEICSSQTHQKPRCPLQKKSEQGICYDMRSCR
jgi:hypothetical protein